MPNIDLPALMRGGPAASITLVATFAMLLGVYHGDGLLLSGGLAALAAAQLLRYRFIGRIIPGRDQRAITTFNWANARRATAWAAILVASLYSVVIAMPQQPESCGWAVWVKLTTSTPNGPPAQWEVKDALPNRNECLQASQRLWKLYRERTGPNVARVSGVDGVSVLTEYKGGGSSTLDLYCFPGSLDPRPR